MSLSSFILATTSADRSNSREDVKRENELLSQDLDNLQRDYKTLKQAVEQLERDYEDSKDFDPLRRYEKLKGMIKRTILHFKLKQNENGTTSGIGGLLKGCKDYAHSLEAAKRREEKVNCEYT